MPLKQSGGVKPSHSTAAYKEGPAAVAHHPHSSQSGLPPPSQHKLQDYRSVIQQQHPDSPHHPQASQQPVTGPYASPHIPSHSLPQQHPSPYVQSVPGPPGQQGGEVPYYTQNFSGTHPSPSYSSAENIDPAGMATATMNRGYPPMYTPQSASPPTVQSPQHHDHNRQMYSQPPMYGYPPYSVPQQSPYGQHPVQAPPMGNNFIPQQPNQQLQQHASHPVPPAMTGSPGSKMPQQQMQRQGTGMSPAQPPPPGPQTTPGLHHGHPANNAANPNAAPGPIPATTPLVVRQDQNGVQWIAFEYSRDRVKMEYTIRCDVESVDVNSLSPEFKTENCVYPRACCPKDQYKGNRLHYESECNTVGWALAQLNPPLRGKRGLIQRAVDSWRNSNQDPRLRSRRVRRMAKMNSRKASQVQHGTQMAAPGAPAPGGAVAHGLTAPGPRAPPMGMGGQMMHHHHDQPSGPATGGAEDVSAGNEYNEGAQTHHHQNPVGNPSANDLRQTHNFYPPYPQAPGSMVNSGIPSSDPISHVGGHAPHHHQSAVATSSTVKHQDSNTEDEDNTALFGDLPEAKRRKFILVDDAQRGTRVRVRVMLDQVRMAEMPDSYRKINSVFPRSWYATEMQDVPTSPRRGGRWPEDNDNSTETRTLVPVPMMDGSETELPVPKMTRERRGKEVVLNDLGWRMSWSQSRVFSGRTLFLQRSLDAYRNKMRSTMVAAGQDTSNIAPHFETRAGKRKWLDRAKRTKRDSSP